MQILEHQNIQFNNLISYNTNVKTSDILKLTKYISDHLYVLDLIKKDNIIFSETDHINEDTVRVEILIPVKGEIKKCNEFDYKPVFTLNNAVTIRHEGSLDELHNTECQLYEFIKSHKFQVKTSPYHIIVRNGDANSEDCIIDICIGVN